MARPVLLQHALHQAQTQHKAGRIRQAIESYRRILKSIPLHIDVNATGTKTSYLTIADAAAGDTIDLVGVSSVAIANVTAGNLTKVTLGAAATLDQYLDSAASTLIADAGASLVKYFVFENNTYLVIDNAIAADTPDDTATFDSGKDAVVKLTGVIDLTTATITSEVLTIA